MNNKLISHDEAFRAMLKFLETYCIRSGRKADLAAVLSDIQSVSEDGLPADPAAWNDWLEAVGSVREQNV
jgi:hypothetical protein